MIEVINLHHQRAFRHELPRPGPVLGLPAEGGRPQRRPPPLGHLFRRKGQGGRLKLHGAPGRMADEEDVALSAFKSFCRGTCDGRFPQLLECEDPWPLLLALTMHKAVDLVRHERRVKRGGPGLLSAQSDAHERPRVDGDVLSQVIGREPDPRWAYEVAEECQELLDRLSDTLLRAIALWKIEGYTTE